MAFEDPNTKFPRDIKGPQSDYGGSDVDEALIQAASQSAPHAPIHDNDTDYGSDFDSEAEQEIVRILAAVERGGARAGKEVEDDSQLTIKEEENASGRKCRVFLPNVVSGSSGRTGRTSFYTARGSGGSAGLVDEQGIGDDEMLDASYCMFCLYMRDTVDMLTGANSV